jgi:hypothetical protein
MDLPNAKGGLLHKRAGTVQREKPQVSFVENAAIRILKASKKQIQSHG